MADRSRLIRQSRHHQSTAAASAVLRIRDLHAFYGSSHALQGVDLTLEQGVHAVVGRNGMGKTTMCNAIMGLVRQKTGSIRYMGEELTGLQAHTIAAMGIGYTPQGRRLWPSLTVDEHLKLGSSGRGAWSVDRIYSTFPRLHDRRRNSAGQLSGGEQQMLAISRALLRSPRLLVLDEPTEGLAPVIVDHVQSLLATLANEGDVAILLIEQNISVATSVSENVGIMVNGRISQVVSASALASDRSLQERLLGVGRQSHETLEPQSGSPPADSDADAPAMPVASEVAPDEPSRSALEYIPPTRWSAATWRDGGQPREAAVRPVPDPAPLNKAPAAPVKTADEPVSPTSLFGNEVYVVGTFDTKGAELTYIRDRIGAHGLAVRTVDLSTFGTPSPADVPPHLVAGYHGGGANKVFTGDRGESVRAMSEAFRNWLLRQRNIGGVISAGGSGGTALVTPGMRALPIGVPKIMISTVGSGDVGEYVGASDIMMMYSVSDILGLNRISRRILANGANALAGMVKEADRVRQLADQGSDRPGLGLTMFGVTTTAVRQITMQLASRYDCMVFHATGTGGRSMEKLADSGMLAAAIDLTTTEVCDLFMGGVFPATEDRFGAFIRTRIPYVGSVGALDMVNFGPRDSVPDRYAERSFVEHNPQVTLMRTTPEENARMGTWIADRLNEMDGPVRFLLPEGGVSALDAANQPFHDPEADAALFDSISRRFRESAQRRLVRTPHHINDPAFAKTAIDALREVDPGERRPAHVRL